MKESYTKADLEIIVLRTVDVLSKSKDTVLEADDEDDP